MDICRIGLIGAGNVGRRHAQVLRSFPDGHLAGIADVIPEAAAALARDAGQPARPADGPEADRPGAYTAADPLESR
jgi:predicted dehydrogenase